MPNDSLRTAAEYRLALSNAAESNAHVVTVVALLHEAAMTDRAVAAGVMPLIRLLDHLTCEVDSILEGALKESAEEGRQP